MAILELKCYNERQQLGEAKPLSRHLIMNYHQEKALRHPILGTMPGSTSAQPRITSQDGYRLSVSLTVIADRGTVQSNDGRAIWHCTVAILKKGSDAITVEEWTPEAHELARQIGEQTLEGVGDRDTLFNTETDEYVLHLYLALTEEEQEMLPPVR
jgi:hypothetical protein